MEGLRYHVGQSSIGTESLERAPLEATVSWIEWGPEVNADFAAKDLEDEIARWESAGHDASIHRRAFQALRDHTGASYAQ